MSDKRHDSDDRRQSVSKTGKMPRPIREPEDEGKPEPPPRPSTLPEYTESEATTGAMPVISEDDQKPLDRDADAAAGSK